MDHIHQRIVGSKRISMIKGYSGYNHIVFHEDGRDKIAFTTPWGTFRYDKCLLGS